MPSAAWSNAAGAAALPTRCCTPWHHVSSFIFLFFSFCSFPVHLTCSSLVQEKLLTELKRKREKASGELKEARAGKREAEKRCRLLEEEKEAICDDYEGRLQQQVGGDARMHP